MMKHSVLRCFMKSKRNLPQDLNLKNSSLIIDGDSYFRKAYSESGCKFILGGEFDRYADYLKKSLLGFKESNVNCYVVFKGDITVDIERRKEIHQKLIDEKTTIVPGDGKYYEPIFVKDVCKQVLEELKMKYYVCEKDSRATLVALSKEYNCPILTHHIEYCLLGMSCVTPDFVNYDAKRKRMSCKMYTPEAYRPIFPIYDSLKPIFMTVIDEDGPLYEKIQEIVERKKILINPVKPLIYWIKKQKRDEAIEKLANFLSAETERKIFLETIDEIRKLISYKRYNKAVTYFKAENIYVNSKDSNWLQNGAMVGKVAKIYMNLRNNGCFSGSWVICDRNKDDAMLPALDIIMFANSILTNSNTSAITFIRRHGDKTCSGEIKSDFKEILPKTSRGRNANFLRSSDELFIIFVESAIPGFDWSKLRTVPEDCWLLLISLVYYISKANSDFITAAYCILLSYVTLGPISEQVGLIKRSNVDMCHSLKSNSGKNQENCTYEDCLTAAHAAIDYFYEGDIKKTFDRSVLHDLAEFQHCLQHMNYLNKLCGEKIKCTNYSKTYNGTFVFNVLLRVREAENPMLFFDSHLKDSVSVFRFFMQVKDVFENCLSSIEL